MNDATCDAMRACYDWERLEALSRTDMAAGYAAGLGCYVSGAWKFFRAERARLPSDTGRLEIALRLSELVPLTMAVAQEGPLGGDCRENVLALVRSGDVKLARGYDVLYALWRKDRSGSKQWLRELIAHLGTLHYEDVRTSPDMNALLREAVTQHPETAAQLIVEHEAWVVLIDMHAAARACAPAVAPLLVPLLEPLLGTRVMSDVLLDNSVMVRAAADVALTAKRASVQAGLYTMMCLVCPTFNATGTISRIEGLGEAARRTPHGAFAAAWRPGGLADAAALLADETLLRQWDRALVVRVAAALRQRFRQSDTWGSDAARVWDRAWAWERRRTLVLCTAQRAQGPRPKIARRAAPSPWKDFFAYSCHGDLACTLVQNVAQYL